MCTYLCNDRDIQVKHNYKEQKFSDLCAPGIVPILIDIM